MLQDAKCLLRCKNLSKKFGSTYVIKDINFELYEGEIKGLAGHNGAGKSVLVNTLGGMYPLTDGEILYDNKPVNHLNHQMAQKKGFYIVPQELNVAEKLSVADNIYLCQEDYHRKKSPFVNRKKIVKDAERMLEQYFNIKIDASLPAGMYDTIIRRIIQVVRCLAAGAKVIVFDETTAGLAQAERQQLFGHIRRLAQRKVGIIYISHIISEMFELCDDIVVLRDGNFIAEHIVKDITPQILVSDIIGKKYEGKEYVKSSPSEKVLLDVSDLTSKNDEIKNFSLKLHESEIIGLYGLRDQGQNAMVELLYGAVPRKAGTIKINGKTLDRTSPKTSIDNKMVYLSERGVKTTFANKSISENIVLLRSKFIESGKFVHTRQENEYAKNVVKDFSVKGVTSLKKRVGSLSGGNVQKVLLSRIISVAPSILIFIEPTHGIDIGVTEEIKTLLTQMASEGKGIIIVTSEIDDVIDICNQAAIVRNGRIEKTIEATRENRELIMHESSNYGD